MLLHIIRKYFLGGGIEVISAEVMTIRGESGKERSHLFTYIQDQNTAMM